MKIFLVTISVLVVVLAAQVAHSEPLYKRQDSSIPPGTQPPEHGMHRRPWDGPQRQPWGGPHRHGEDFRHHESDNQTTTTTTTESTPSGLQQRHFDGGDEGGQHRHRHGDGEEGWRNDHQGHGQMDNATTSQQPPNGQRK